MDDKSVSLGLSSRMIACEKPLSTITFEMDMKTISNSINAK